MELTRCWLAPAVVVVLMLSGCSTAQAPASFGESQDARNLQCVHLARGDRVLIGDTVTSRSSALRIRSVNLVDARGVRVVRAWLLRTPGGTSLGVTDVPPSRTIASEIGWDTRVNADGAELAAKSSRNVVLEVQKTASTRGSAAAIRLRVVASDHEYDVDSGVRYRFPQRCF
ncbi:hypothetical protein GCM10009869_17610 [Amnibacterium kyonggiense]